MKRDEEHLATLSPQVCETSTVITSGSQLKNAGSGKPLARSQNCGAAGVAKVLSRAGPVRSARHTDGEVRRGTASARAGPGPARRRGPRTRFARRGRCDLLPSRRHSPGPGQHGHHNYRSQIPRSAATRRLPQVHLPLTAPLPANCPLLPADARRTGATEAQKTLLAFFQGRFPLKDDVEESRGI